MRHSSTKILVGLATLTILAFASSEAKAEQVRCDVHAIRASASAGSEMQISPQLEPYRAHLLRPPLTAFTSFELIETQNLTLTQGRAQPLTLQPNITGEFEVTSSENGLHMLRLSLQHNNRNLVNTRFRATQGHPFFVVVGSVIPRGTLVLGFVCQ